MANKKKRSPKAPSKPTTPSHAVALATVALLLTGLGSSLYLGHLYLKVHRPGVCEPGTDCQVESFCALSESFNCVTVATSEYSSFLGLPIALYGIEFFLGSLALVLLSLSRALPVKRWDSVLFVANLGGLGVSAFLAWISATHIHSFCIMCCLVYGVNVLLFVLLLLGGRKLEGSLFTAGPKQLLAAVRSPRWGGTAVLVAGLFVSQFFWVPGLFKPTPKVVHEYFKGQATSGLTIGPADAPIQIEEYTDFQCPYCGKAHDVMMRIVQRFPGKIRLTHRDFPLDNACNPKIPRPFHRQACQAAYYARCAAKQNKYWPYEAMLFPNRAFLSEETLQRFGEKLGMDVAELSRCAKHSSTRQAVLDDINEALKRNLQGTPTYFIAGESEPVVGFKPMPYWENKIVELLKKRGIKAAPAESSD